MRVIFDTNVFVSFALGSRALAPLQRSWQAERLTVLISTYLLAEIEDVLKRPKLARYLESDDTEAFLELVTLLGEAVIVKQPFPEFSDPKDRYLLAMLRDGEGDVLVTGDAALLELKTFDEKPIVSPAMFMKDYLQDCERGT